MKRTINRFTYDRKDNDGEINHGISMTVPDQAMTPQEILVRFTQNRVVPTRQPVYSDDYLPDPKTLDLADLEQLQHNLHEQIKDKEAYLDATQAELLKYNAEKKAQEASQEAKNFEEQVRKAVYNNTQQKAT